MEETYENTIISSDISQIELQTIPTDEEGYESLRFSTNRNKLSPQTLNEHGLISWILVCLIAAIALAVSVISSVITGYVVYKTDKSSAITNENINELKRRLNNTLLEKLEQQLTGSNWNPWSIWGSCTVECGGGLRLRSRQCNENVCVGNNQEVELCNTGKCTVDTIAPVAFFASLTGKSKNLTAGQIIVFQSVKVNIGGAYNVRTGEFITPVGGVYMFSSSILSDNNAEAWCHFDVNDSNKGNIYVHSTNGRHDQGSQTVILQLKQGNVVTVQSTKSAGSLFGEQFTTFSGFLLSQQID